VIEKMDEEKVVCGPKEMLPGDLMISPLQAPSSDMTLEIERLGVAAEKACVLDMVDQRDDGVSSKLLQGGFVMVSLPRQEFAGVSLPQAFSLPQVGSASLSLSPPRHETEDDSMPQSLPRQEPAIVSLPQQAGTCSSPPASPIQGSGLRVAEVSPGVPRHSKDSRTHSPLPSMGVTSESSSQPTRGCAKKVQGTGVFLGGRYSREEVIKYGGISEHVAKSVRSSERIRAQSNADAT
jgi:hypothetical protein